MIENSLFLDACRGKKGVRPPIWFMRQAGRYLSEYLAVRAKHSMLDVIRTPELAAEVTLQPIRRFGFDASIIFADILNPLIGMGLDLEFIEKTGPVISNPVRSRADIEKLHIPDAIENTGYTADAIRLVTRELNPRGVPLIGFAGAPFTLSAYAIEGGKIGALQRVKEFMFTEPESWHLLQEKFVALLVDYLLMQVEAGASALQIFDSWLGQLSPQQYLVYVEPYLAEIFRRLRQKTSVPLLFFSTSTSGLYPYFAQLDIDVLGVDWRIDLQTAASLINNKLPLQGNLDPILLIRGGAALDREVAHILKQAQGLPAHIFNLGHGILPPTPIEHVSHVLDLIRGVA
jgi:uroporphyrinogen decarboxylase